MTVDQVPPTFFVMTFSQNVVMPLDLALLNLPDEPGIYSKMADLYFNNRHFDLARICYFKAIDENPSSMELKLSLGKTFFSLGRHREAKVIVEFLLSRESILPEVFILQAHLHCQDGEFSKAEECYMTALKLNRHIQDRELEKLLWGLLYNDAEVGQAP